MQYNGYEIQTTDYSCIIRDSRGNYITSVPTEQEAKEYIDDIDEINIRREPIDWYKRFERYCNKLPGKCYPDGNLLCTTNQSALNRYIKSFEKANSVRVIVSTEYISGDYYYAVTDVEED